MDYHDMEISKLLENWGYDNEILESDTSHISLSFLETPAQKKRISLESDTSDTSHISPSCLTLQELLDGGTDGKMILSFYKTEKKLNDFYRQKLADIIVREELQSDIRKSFPNALIEHWSEQIINYFKEESYEVWAGCTKGKNRDTAAGRGILLNRYYNLRRKLLKVGAITNTLNTVNETIKDDDLETDEEHEDLIQWLKNTKTVHLVFETWERTTPKRISMLKTMEIHKYMDDFPAVKCFDGYRLLEADFKNLYPEAEMKLFGEWSMLSSFIMNKIPAKEQAEINDCFTPDGKNLKILRALFNISHKKRNYKKKKQWRPSRLESKDGLFQYVKSVADILPCSQRKKDKFYELGLNLGPQLYAVSPDEDNISECHLIINDTIYNVGSPLKAFDIFFKCFHALNICYPKETVREMYFLQKAIYNVHCDTDIQIRDPKTSGLISEYNKFKPVHNNI